MIIFDAVLDKVTYLGRLGENLSRGIRFDIREILKEYPNADIVLLNKRAGDPAAYPVANIVKDAQAGTIVWPVTSGDLAQMGNGTCELIASYNGAILKDDIYTTFVDKSLDGSGTPPAPWEGWVNQILRAATECNNAVAHYPKIVQGTWNLWDVDAEQWVDTGIRAEGADGYSPGVEIQVIPGGHRIIITDAAGPHSFDVMNGDPTVADKRYAKVINTKKTQTSDDFCG